MRAIKILIVDNEIIQRKLWSMIIKGWISEAIIQEASDGEEGLSWMTTESFSVLISDIYMPRMDGMTMVEEAREKRVIPCCVILLTGNQEVFESERFLSLDATARFMKPVSSDKIISIIRAVTNLE